MKRIAIGIAAVAALIGAPASAASPPSAPGPLATWVGWYVGLNAGGGWSNDSGISNNVTSIFCNAGLAGCPGGGPLGTAPGYGIATAQAVPTSFDSKLSGFLGGGQIGYNWQTGVAVWGLEADFQSANIKGNGSSTNTVLARNTIGIGNEFVNVAGTGSQKLDFLGTLRGRLGWSPSNPVLLYVTAGLAYGHTSTSASFTEQASIAPLFNAAATGSVNAWREGWTIGGGFEWMAAPRWSIKGEYLYYDLGTVTVNNTMIATNGAAPFFGVTTASEVSYRGSIIHGGISYHF